jgi:hypothetical protein
LCRQHYRIIGPADVKLALGGLIGGTVHLLESLRRRGAGVGYGRGEEDALEPVGANLLDQDVVAQRVGTDELLEKAISSDFLIMVIPLLAT